MPLGHGRHGGHFGVEHPWLPEWVKHVVLISYRCIQQIVGPGFSLDILFITFAVYRFQRCGNWE